MFSSTLKTPPIHADHDGADAGQLLSQRATAGTIRGAA